MAGGLPFQYGAGDAAGLSQRPHEGAGGRVAGGRVFAQLLEQHLLDTRREIGAPLLWWRRRGVDLRVQDRLGVYARERCAAGHRLIGDDPQRVDVGAGAGVANGDRLGGHVLGRADAGAGLGQAAALGGAGDPEVHQRQVVVRPTKALPGFDVAVDDAVPVGEVQGFGKL